MTVRIGICGCGGRMGRMLAQVGHAREGVVIAAGIEQPGSELLGRDLGELAGLGPLGVLIGDDRAALFAASDVVVDFTAPASTLANAAVAADTGKGLVVGTTGLSGDDKAVLEKAADVAPIVFAANMSLGVNLLAGVARKVAAALDDEFDIEIVEMHHRHKVDAPSGTALALAEAVAEGRGVVLDEVVDRGRDGVTGARKRGTIGMAALRGGDVVGDHQVIFAADGERIEIGHRASDRGIYARGAITAALWLRGRPAGLYGMDDVLGLAD
ncbi:MAG: 4-hydroxy-tetrahydrodipicolinate reductase [Rhodospirillaceae bacterium]|nr:4-hydroxy-tetrahydrodipicolinate reductase [Rhodospirillaceae bacterium]MBT6203874.1 4-hydroxy-tetrahydrodipicolinate reductase [Rhodospirillaceae bacterium]MBT6512832.1 4-hydroxy-tetrahydrodipicolinate reductase [Rhodospirillaceae bacterium]MBT7615363.1 4-hydroxy-tetrahydrodipicolinate reductase [Rhodospirillaceae bacterium]